MRLYMRVVSVPLTTPVAKQNIEAT